MSLQNQHNSVGSRFWQKHNKPSHNCQRRLKWQNLTNLFILTVAVIEVNYYNWVALIAAGSWPPFPMRNLHTPWKTSANALSQLVCLSEGFSLLGNHWLFHTSDSDDRPQQKTAAKVFQLSHQRLRRTILWAWLQIDHIDVYCSWIGHSNIPPCFRIRTSNATLEN